MQKVKKKSFVLIPHKKDCRCKSWSGLTDGHYWGNFAGNPNAERGRHHIWHRVLCNDPNCNGKKAVHSSVLVSA
jgi:hypothetical protein